MLLSGLAPAEMCERWRTLDVKEFASFLPFEQYLKAWDLPAMPGCFVFREDHGAVIPARDGIYDLDFGTGALKRS